MRRNFSQYPVSICLAKSLEAICIESLAERLKYRNINKLLRKLDEWLITGQGSADFLLRFRKADIVPEDLLAEALAHTAQVHEIERHKRQLLYQERLLREFRPHIFIRTERETLGSYFIALLASKVKHIRRQELSFEKEEGKQLKLAGRICKKHFQDNNGISDFFGIISSYKVYLELGRGWSISVTGEAITKFEDKIQLTSMATTAKFNNKLTKEKIKKKL